MTKNKSPAAPVWDLVLAGMILAASLACTYCFTFNTRVPGAFSWGVSVVFLVDLIHRRGLAASPGGRRRDLVLDALAALPAQAVLGWIAPAGAGWSGMVAAAGLLPLVKLWRAPALLGEFRERWARHPGASRLVVFGFWLVQAAHGMALGWILVGAAEASRPPGDQYIRALYWCVTTIATIGYGDYYPDHNHNDQILYTIAVQILGAGLFGCIIGNVSGWIVNRDVARAEYLKKMEEVNACLKTSRLPAPLEERVRDYYAYLWKTRRSVTLRPVLDELPPSLSTDVLLHLNRGLLGKVGLFQNAGESLVRDAVRRLRPMVFPPGDEILRQGEHGDCMYFLSAGEVDVLVNGMTVARLGAGSHFGETALIQKEHRMATIRAAGYCEVSRLDKGDFDSLREHHPDFDARVRQAVAERMADTRRKTRRAPGPDSPS